MRILRDSRVNCFMKLAGPWAMDRPWNRPWATPWPTPRFVATRVAM